MQIIDEVVLVGVGRLVLGDVVAPGAYESATVDEPAMFTGLVFSDPFLFQRSDQYVGGADRGFAGAEE